MKTNFEKPKNIINDNFNLYKSLFDKDKGYLKEPELSEEDLKIPYREAVRKYANYVIDILKKNTTFLTIYSLIDNTIDYKSFDVNPHDISINYYVYRDNKNPHIGIMSDLPYDKIIDGYISSVFRLKLCYIKDVKQISYCEIKTSPDDKNYKSLFESLNFNKPSNIVKNNLKGAAINFYKNHFDEDGIADPYKLYETVPQYSRAVIDYIKTNMTKISNSYSYNDNGNYYDSNVYPGTIYRDNLLKNVVIKLPYIGKNGNIDDYVNKIHHAQVAKFNNIEQVAVITNMKESKMFDKLINESYSFEKPKSIVVDNMIEGKKISSIINNLFMNEYDLYKGGRISLHIAIEDLRNDKYKDFIQEKQIIRNNKPVGYIFYSGYTDLILMILFYGISIQGMYIFDKNDKTFTSEQKNILNLLKDDLKSIGINLNESFNAFKKQTNIVNDNIGWDAKLNEFLKKYNSRSNKSMPINEYEEFGKLMKAGGYTTYFESDPNKPNHLDNPNYIIKTDSEYVHELLTLNTCYYWINMDAELGYVLIDIGTEATLIMEIMITPNTLYTIREVSKNQVNESIEFKKPTNIIEQITPQHKLKEILKQYSELQEWESIYGEGGIDEILELNGYRKYKTIDYQDIMNSLYVRNNYDKNVKFIISPNIIHKYIKYFNSNQDNHNTYVDIYIKPGKSNDNVILIIGDYEKMMILVCRKKGISYIFESNYSGNGYSLNMNSGTNIIGNRPPYEYEIVPLNHKLEQKQSATDNDIYVHPGSRVIGFALKDDRKVQGTVYRIVKNTDGTISFVYVLDEKTGTFVKLKPEITVIKF